MSQTYINYGQKLEFLTSGFHQYLLIHLDTQNHIQGNMPTSFVNITLRLEDIGGGDGSSAWGINKIKNYISDSYDNVLFTPESDFESIYQYEYYKGVYYIRAKPFEETIVMHILPKTLKASDKILLIKDSDVTFEQINAEYNMDTDQLSTHFKSFDLETNEFEDRPSSAKPYPKFHKFGTGDTKKIYQKHTGNNWTKETYKNSYAEYSLDISNKVKNLMNVQINSGYSYNDSSAIQDTSDNPYAIHYTGIKDNTNEQAEDRAVLMDANYDNVSGKTNNIQQMEYYTSNNNKDIRFPLSLNQKSFKAGFNNQHTNANKIFHKTIKYFNDILYTEEDGQFVIGEWKDPSV